ncbi:hypothetical protein Cme02nite_28490 [Catellatospora methionotrophica]|uniref:Flavodoxin-like domain-containing protein n=1 Tax=Catellatospora methionotrophica TaxID=121620 RepID=A0A8J3L4Y7_9ACTN|nr:flavodoxin [Catellatospora methionotrophica]GIG14517.1 hypothetical protein Cme02nite_28490 [Catellatospora methionotrophica]
MHSIAIGRRALLRLSGAGALGTAATAALAGCGADAPPPPATSAQPGGTASPDGQPRVLLAYFSRAGWNYADGGRTFLKVGNTAALAEIISKLIRCDTHRIQAAEPYSDDYDATVARNVREQNADARPAIADPLPSITEYDTVLLASGIWNVRAPMIMSTFADGYDFSGKTVYPVTTYAMSGLGTTERDYAASCRGADVGAGLAVRGEQVNQAQAAAETWLRRSGLLT